MSAEKKQIRISVRGLVEFLLRSGDIEASSGAARQTEAMQEGARIHRKIQSRRGADYQAEVPLKFEKEFDTFTLLVEGRADGIIPGSPARQLPVTVEEIKGIYREPDSLEEAVPVHLAQAKCYAAIYAIDNKEKTMRVRLTYVQMESEQQRRFEEDCEATELIAWFEELVEEYSRWAELEIRHQKERDASMVGLEFPFPYREGQRDMVVAVYRTILRKKQIFVQAPTGIGKTMSAVFPAVRAIGEGEGERIFYLTAKTIARTVAEEAFSILRDKGLVFKTVTLTAKEKLCPQTAPECDPELCPRAKGHYDRVNAALFEMVSDARDYSRERILEHCGKHGLCPHEFQLDLTLFSDAVIGDYNYAFDPRAKLRRFFGEGQTKGEHIFLVDEAHNLADRGREMFSAELGKEEFLKVKRVVKGKLKRAENALARCNKAMLALKKECAGKCRVLESVDGLLLPLMNLAGAVESLFADTRKTAYAVPEELRELYFRVRAFLSVYDLLDENYLIYGHEDETGDFRLKLFCVHPAKNLQAALDAGRAAVFFSATLLPLPYYQSLLSAREDDFSMYLPSPFPKENRLLAVCTDVSSKYTRRGKEEYTRMAAYIHRTITAKPGNYLVFFPSYQMMDAVADIYEEVYATLRVDVLRQSPRMGEREREDFLHFFDEEKDAEGADGRTDPEGKTSSEADGATVSERWNDRARVGFCVMGGVFAEGIDLAGERLIGAIVVGTGLPQIGDERELLRAYYEEHGRNGFDYAYRLPGMNKVLQAAGRVIRTQEDRGVILLLDERFAGADYRDLFPLEWNDRRRCNSGRIGDELKDFWNSPKKT